MVTESFGRAQEKKILRERIKSFGSGFRQNIAVIGKNYIGKTTLIKNILSDISQNNIIVIYAECREEPFDFFSHRFIGSLLYQYLNLKGTAPQKDDLKALIKNCRKGLPKTTDAIEKIEDFIRKKDYDSAYDTLLDLSKFAHADSGINCAVIIEEFDKLAGYKLNQPFSALGKKIMSQRNTFYIVTSSSVQQARLILAEKLQLLFGNFEIIQLEEFDFASSRDFLLSRLEGFSISELYGRFIINFTNGHPFYLDVIANKIKELLVNQRKARVTTSILEQALDEVLFDSNGELYQHFINVINANCRNKNGIDILSVLTLISDGNCRANQIVESLNSSVKSVSGAIEGLKAAGLVEKTGVFNKIDDPVLRFWLKNVYHKSRTDFTADSSLRKKIFMLNIKKSSSDFMRSSKEDLYEKIVDLFKAFGDDIIEIEHKRYVLPKFGDVATRVIGENGPYIVCHSKGKNWICQIRERKVGEKHILDFLKDSKAGKYKFHRKVLIVIDGMEDNAKLLAKGSGVWTWNLRTLNMLLDLYGKYKVIKLQ